MDEKQNRLIAIRWPWIYCTITNRLYRLYYCLYEAKGLWVEQTQWVGHIIFDEFDERETKLLLLPWKNSCIIARWSVCLPLRTVIWRNSSYLLPSRALDFCRKELTINVVVLESDMQCRTAVNMWHCTCPATESNRNLKNHKEIYRTNSLGVTEGLFNHGHLRSSGLQYIVWFSILSVFIMQMWCNNAFGGIKIH